jgi:hypothetical protein
MLNVFRVQLSIKRTINNMKYQFNNIISFIEQRARIFTLVSGSLIVSTWTILRFFTRPTTFDLVGQQVIAHQWLANIHSNVALIGPTNYLFKLLVVYIPFDVAPGSQRLKLITMTLLINILTFILITFVLEKIWKEFYPKVTGGFYLAMLWLATLSGSIYWIEFANSRNLEIAGGLLLAYWIIRLRRLNHKKHLILIAAFGALLFFADPLQIYMVALPATLFVSIAWLMKNRGWPTFKNITLILASLFVALAGSLVLKSISKSIFGLDFITTTTANHTQLYIWLHSLAPTLKQFSLLYYGGNELGKPLEAINILFAVFAIVIGILLWLKRRISKHLFGLIATFWITDIAVYIFSGQALQGGTSRYLIMTAPMLGLLIAAVLEYKSKLKLVWLALIAVLLINLVAILSVLQGKWDSTFPIDAHISSAMDYMQTHSYSFGYSGMSLGIPVAYYSNFKTTFIPLDCLGNSLLIPAHLFYYTSSIRQAINKSNLDVPLIIDGQTIVDVPTTCTLDNIKTQLGKPIKTDQLSDGSVVLIYNADHLKSVFQN